MDLTTDLHGLTRIREKICVICVICERIKNKETMTEQEIRAKFAPAKCDNQIEFDDRMHAINNQQTIENHPYLDRLRELNMQRTFIETQKRALDIQLNTIRAERLEIEQRRKDINRVFYQLKYELMELNPKGLKNETVNDGQQ